MRDKVKSVLLLSVVLVGAVVFALCGKPAVSDAEELKKEGITSDEAYRLLEEAERLKAEGHGEEAAELLRKAERVEVEARERRRLEKEPREREERIISEEARDLFEKARRLKEEGRLEDAEEVGRRAERVEAEAREKRSREKERPEGEKSVISEGARDLFEKAGRLKEEGRLDEAEEVGRRAERVEAEARERKQMGKERQPDREVLLEEVRLILEKAERLSAEGRGGEAEQLRARADRLEAQARGPEREPEERLRRKEGFVQADVRERLRGELLEAQRKLDLLSERYAPKHPERLTAERLVREIEEQLVLEEARQVREKYARGDRDMPEEAKRLLQKAAEVGRQAERRGGAEKIEVQIREHLEESERLKEMGKLEAAEEHIRQAERLKRELRDAMPREGEPRPAELPSMREELRDPVLREPTFRPEMPRQENVLVEIRELRRDVNGLREELGEVKRLLRELLER